MSTPLTYGTTVYLKNQADGIPNQWLSGCRSGGREVVTRDKNKEGDLIKTYQWQLWERWDSMGSGELVAGDYAYLKCLYLEDHWLSGGRGSEEPGHPGNTLVITTDGGTQFGTSFEWRFLFNHDSGGDGRSINLGDIIYLNVGVVGAPSLFLTGARGGEGEVFTFDRIDKDSTFRWLLEAV